MTPTRHPHGTHTTPTRHPLALGYDLMEWLGHYLCLTDPPELLHIAGKLCAFGYIYPVTVTASLCVKDDNTLYRFQVITVASDQWPVTSDR